MQKVLCGLIFLQFYCLIFGEITGDDYSKAPRIFYMDSYDDCMLPSKSSSLFCSFTYHLSPINQSNHSEIWTIVQALTDDDHNYNHTQLRHAICLRKTCPDYQPINYSLIGHINHCYDKKLEASGLRGLVTDLRCLDNNSSYPIDYFDVTVLFIALLYIMFVLTATLYEGLARYKTKEQYELQAKTLGRIFYPFSIAKNWYRLTAPNTGDAIKLRGIQGVRFYNMICVIMSHGVLMNMNGPVENPRYVETVTEKPLNMFLVNGGYAVQTFFVISGWLLSFNLFKMADTKRITWLNVFTVILYRLIRLVPVLAVALAFHSTWIVHLVSGPLSYYTVGLEKENCRTNWWTNLLFVNNHVNTSKMCMLQTWYIAADTQLFILSLLVLLLCLRWRHLTTVILTSSIAIGMLINGLLAYFDQHDILLRQYPEDIYHLNGPNRKIHIDLYGSTYSNISGYMIGLLFGYFYYKYSQSEQPKLKNKFLLAFWWITTFGFPIFVIMIASVMYDKSFKYTRIESALYWALGKPLFAWALGGMMFAFTQNVGWFAKWFCEWSCVQVFGRLTYSAYICHFFFIRIRVASVRAPQYLSDFVFLHTTLSDIVVAYCAATVLCLLVEMPVSELQKLWLPSGTNKKPDDICKSTTTICTKI